MLAGLLLFVAGICAFQSPLPACGFFALAGVVAIVAGTDNHFAPLVSFGAIALILGGWSLLSWAWDRKHAHVAT
jgi:hypothetical protein